MHNNNNSRKKDHIFLALEEDAEEPEKYSFEKIFLMYKALPEIDFDEINLETNFLGKRLKFPIIIEAITGGFEEGKIINEILSSIASEFGIGFMVGSQRPMIENETLTDTYKINGNPPIVIGNIGAVQLNYGITEMEIIKAIKSINADAIAFHVNPLQECFQLNGNKNFKNLKNKINEISSILRSKGIKVIVKEVGHGLSYDDVKDLNVDCIDVAGYGGTNWALIEGKRSKNDSAKFFYDWGIPTLDSIIEVSRLKEKKNIEIIGSGGIRNGIDAAKCFALNADVVGMAQPFLKQIYNERKILKIDEIDEKLAKENLRKFLNKFINELKISLFLTGSRNIKEIRGKYKIKI